MPPPFSSGRISDRVLVIRWTYLCLLSEFYPGWHRTTALLTLLDHPASATAGISRQYYQTRVEA